MRLSLLIAVAVALAVLAGCSDSQPEEREGQPGGVGGAFAGSAPN